jgi:hypothetical protein
MLSLIGSTIKYTGLILMVLVLSHIIQVRGVSISQHVENTLDSIAHFSPTREVKRVTREMSSAIQTRSNDTDLDKHDSEDQRELKRVIERSRN